METERVEEDKKAGKKDGNQIKRRVFTMKIHSTTLGRDAELRQKIKEEWRKRYDEARKLTFMECPKCGHMEVRYRTICLNCNNNLPITYDDSKEVIQIPGMAMERIQGSPPVWLPKKILYGRSYHPNIHFPEDCGPWVVIDNTKGCAWTEKFNEEDDVWKWINYEPVQNYYGKWLNT